MDIPIILSSSQCTSGPTHNFTTKIVPSINLDPNTKYKIALVSLNMSYSWHNVAEQYKNNTIKFSPDGGTKWTPINFPDGNYSYQDLQDFINLRIKAEIKSDNKEPLELNVKLTFDLTTLKIILFLATNFQLDLTGNFCKLLGFEPKIYTTTTISQNTPDITNSIDSLLINCSLLSDSYVFGQLGSSLASVDISGLPLSYPFKFEPRVLLFHEINTNVINSITISVSDVLYRPISLNNTAVEATLILRKV